MSAQTPESVLQVEKECEAKGLNAPATHSTTINERIAKVEYIYNEHIPMMTCVIFAVNGFKFVGHNLIVSAANYDGDLAKRLSYAQAFSQMQSHEAYLLKERLYQNK